MSRKNRLFDSKEKVVNNPFMHIAQGISKETSSQVWEEKPVTISEFIESKKFLNQKWNGRSGCRPKIMEIAENITKEHVRECMLLLGKGSGKDFIASIIHLYGIYRCLCMANPQSYFGLGPSPIYFINTARNEKQAKKVFFLQMLALLTECPWFEGKYREPPGVDSIIFDKGIQALSVNSQAFGWLGFNTIQWVGDELAFFLENDTDEESASRAEECWQSAFGSCKTRFPLYYKMIGITTPRYDDDFVMKKFYELQGRKDDAFVAQAATWEIHPHLSKEDFKHQFEVDYRRTMRDFGAVPVGVIESFWPDPKFVEDSVCETCRQCSIYQNRSGISDIFCCSVYDKCLRNGYKGNGYWRDWFKPPVTHNDYWMHFDLAKSKDRIGFSLARIIGEAKVELDVYKLIEKYGDEYKKQLESEDDKYETKGIIEVAAIGFVSTNRDLDSRMLKNGEFYYTAILDYLILELKKRGFNIVGISFDQFQSHYMKQQLEDRGFQVELISCDRTDEVPVAAKYAVVESRVEYPYSYVLSEEAKYLKYIEGKKVDHAKKSCFTGDTKVKLLNGVSKTFEELEKQWDIDHKEFWIYSFDVNRNIMVPGLARNPRKTVKVEEFIEIKLDNDQTIKCTKDHNFILRNGFKKEAKDIVIGDSLMPLYTEYCNLGKNQYEKFFDISKNEWIFTHRHISCFKYGRWQTKKEVVHHKDFNSKNNNPENLELMDIKHHVAYHKELVHKQWRENYMQMCNFSTKEYRGNENITKRNLKIKEALQKSNFDFGALAKKNWIEGQFKIKNGIECYQYRKDITLDIIENLVRKGYSQKQICNELNCTKKCLLARIKDGGLSNFKTMLMFWNIKRNYSVHNKRIDITIEKIHKLITDNKSIAEIMEEFKCGKNVLVRIIKEHGYNGIDDLKEKGLLNINHKVIDIRIVRESRQMYDLSVDKYHNFALDSGVFVDQSKDVWDSFASSIFCCEKFLMAASGFEMLEGDDDDD